jgi:hypothetical protein
MGHMPERTSTRSRLDSLDKLYQRVFKLVHAKSNYAKKDPDIWLRRRDDNGQLDQFEPQQKAVDDSYSERLNQLTRWYGTKQAPFSKTQLTQSLRPAIFGDQATRQSIEAFIDAAVAR